MKIEKEVTTNELAVLTRYKKFRSGHEILVIELTDEAKSNEKFSLQDLIRVCIAEFMLDVHALWVFLKDGENSYVVDFTIHPSLFIDNTEVSEITL